MAVQACRQRERRPVHTGHNSSYTHTAAVTIMQTTRRTKLTAGGVHVGRRDGLMVANGQRRVLHHTMSRVHCAFIQLAAALRGGIQPPPSAASTW